MYTYLAYDLTISSELQLSGLVELDLVDYVDVVIKFGKVPLSIKNPVVVLYNMQMSKQECLINIENVATFYILDGREIVIQQAIDGNKGDIQVFLMGTVFAYVLQYHDYLVLHGSAVIVNSDNAVIFSGKSGVGKSTTAAAFVKRGYPVLTDDMVAVKLHGSEELELIPGWPRLKLWQDALDYFGETSEGLISVQNKYNKFEFPVPSPTNLRKRIKISNFYELNAVDEIESIGLKSLVNKIDRLELLIKNTFRYFMLKALNKNSLHLKQCILLASSSNFGVISRPKLGYSLDELVLFLENDMHTKSKDF